MWRPTSVGDVIASRDCELKRPGHRSTRVRVSFGRPVRAPDSGALEPWWCPIHITGPRLDILRPIAGADSMQALVLAMQYAALMVRHEAARGGRLEWLEEPEAIIFAREVLPERAAYELIMTLLSGLEKVAEILDAPGKSGAARRALEALAVLGRDHGRRPAAARGRKTGKSR